MLVGDGSESGGDTPVYEPTQGQLVDPDGHVQRELLLGLGSVRGAGGQIEALAGREHQFVRETVGFDEPALGADGLHLSLIHI